MRALLEYILDRFSELLNDSREYRKSKRKCQSCDNLMHLLDMEKREKSKLLSIIDNLNQPQAEPEEKEPIIFQPIQPKNWKAQRHQLETQSRDRAAQLRKEYEEIKADTNAG